MESMILEFVDGTQINVITIIGGPVNIKGIIRDVLTIEVDPSTIYLEDLKEIFNNTDNLAHLYTYEDDMKIEIGEGYTILLGVDSIHRLVNKIPGKITKDEYENIYSVSIAQMTYDEWTSSKYISNKS